MGICFHMNKTVVSVNTDPSSVRDVQFVAGMLVVDLDDAADVERECNAEGPRVWGQQQAREDRRKRTQGQGTLQTQAT
jgi:hypothetical protein